VIAPQPQQQRACRGRVDLGFHAAVFAGVAGLTQMRGSDFERPVAIRMTWKGPANRQADLARRAKAHAEHQGSVFESLDGDWGMGSDGRRYKRDPTTKEWILDRG
jgi:hypothetical protein